MEPVSVTTDSDDHRHEKYVVDVVTRVVIDLDVDASKKAPTEAEWRSTIAGMARKWADELEREVLVYGDLDASIQLRFSEGAPR